MSPRHWTDEHGVTHESDIGPGHQYVLCASGRMNWWPSRPSRGDTPITCLRCVTRASNPFDICKTLEANSMKDPL